MTDMFEDLENGAKKPRTINLSTILGGGLLASIGTAFVWIINNAMSVQNAFQNPIFMVMTFILMMVGGGLVVYVLYSRPRERERIMLRRSLRTAIKHAQKCEVELAEIKAEFATVAKFIDGYKPSFHDMKENYGG